MHINREILLKSIALLRGKEDLLLKKTIEYAIGSSHNPIAETILSLDVATKFFQSLESCLHLSIDKIAFEDYLENAGLILKEVGFKDSDLELVQTSLLKAIAHLSTLNWTLELQSNWLFFIKKGLAHIKLGGGFHLNQEEDFWLRQNLLKSNTHDEKTESKPLLPEVNLSIEQQEKINQLAKNFAKKTIEKAWKKAYEQASQTEIKNLLDGSTKKEKANT